MIKFNLFYNWLSLYFILLFQLRFFYNWNIFLCTFQIPQLMYNIRMFIRNWKHLQQLSDSLCLKVYISCNYLELFTLYDVIILNNTNTNKSFFIKCYGLWIFELIWIYLFIFCLQTCIIEVLSGFFISVVNPFF